MNQSYQTKKLTLVALLLALNSYGRVLAGLPVDLVTLSMVVAEVSSISALSLVEVGLCDDLVGEELVPRELKDQTETGFVKVLHTDISQILEGGLITVGDHLCQGHLVLHGGKPELWNTLDITRL